MKIVDLSSVVVGAGMRNWVLVKVATDEGLVGWGEATLEWKTNAVVGALEDLRPLMLGADPFRLEHLWQAMTRQQYWRDGIIGMSAIAGIDQALHDVKAQALGVPIYDLLGGAVRDRLRCYSHLGGGDPVAVYADPDPASFADSARSCVEAGFSALKILPVGLLGGLAPADTVSRAVAVVAAVRDAVGPDVEIMLDLHGRASAAAAIELGRALADLRPWFLEEPIPPGTPEALRRVVESQPIPVAAGERLVGRAQFAELLQAGVAVLQPDVCHCGGVAELRRIAALGESAGATVAPHNPLGPIATAHNLHLAAAIPNWLIQEQMQHAVAWWDDVVTNPLRIVDGYASLPVGPGLGTAVDEEAAARHPYEPEAQPRALLGDGSVADW
jgi:galactonate dehydratase